MTLRKTMVTMAWHLWLVSLTLQGGEVIIHTSPVVAEYFSKARENQATLIAFLHSMPKGADLHSHPSGAVATETLVRMAMDQGLYFDRERQSFVVQQPVGPYFSAADLIRDQWAMVEVLEALSLRNIQKNPESGHEHFFRSFDRYLAAVPDELLLFKEVIARAASQKVSCLELMAVAHDTQEWIAAVEQIRREVLDELAAKGMYQELDVRYTYPLYRCVPPELFAPQVDQAIRIARANPELIAGITILGPEDEWHSQTYFQEQMRMIDAAVKPMLEAHRRDPANNPPPPKFNLHAGELTLEVATYESMVDRISTTIRTGHAARIGHGTAIMWERDVYGLLALLRDCRVAVEICLSSSEQILKVAGGENHPFVLYWKAGVPVVLATDDEGIARSNITNEYAKAARWFDLSYGEMKWLAFSSLEYSFLPGESYFVDGDFNRIRPDAQHAVGTSRKAYLQCVMMNEFAEFERKMETVIGQFGWW